MKVKINVSGPLNWSNCIAQEIWDRLGRLGYGGALQYSNVTETSTGRIGCEHYPRIEVVAKEEEDDQTG